MTRLIALALLLALPAAWLHAAPLEPPVRAEVDALLVALERSGCEFNRNGSWHTPQEAKSHLLVKLQYLQDKYVVRSAEQFIDIAASSSSYSGKPYLVRCGGNPPVQSKTWFGAQLKTLRAAAPAPGRGQQPMKRLKELRILSKL